MIADALVVDDATDCLGKHIGNAELLNLSATISVRDRISKYNLLKGRFLYSLTCRT